MKITFKNCNNISEGEILIEEAKLNIKYGSNGTGKSTVARAIELKVENEAGMADLLPFKLREDNPNNLAPEVNGLEQIKSIRIFNEKYLELFTFKPDELVSNSFEIFIKTPNYEQQLQDIEAIVGKIKSVFSNDPDLESFLNDLKELSGSFKLTKSGISKASSGYKALECGNKFEHIPEGLEAYTPFLKHSTNISWIGWQQQGQTYLDISEDCPFCTSIATDKKGIISRLSKEYDKNTIKHLTSIIAVVEKLGKYFSPETRSRIEEITKLKDGLKPEHEDFLIGVKHQIENLIDKLEELKRLSGQSFKEKEKVAEKLPEYRLELDFFDRLNSVETQRISRTLNEKLDEIQSEALALQVAIGKQRSTTKELITKNQQDINIFLSKAGYKYEVLITDESDGHRLRLKHLEHKKTLAGGSQYLSFGERNAFALVLFMFECLARNPNMIVLDDPISSFDKDKKFAILDMLFQGSRSFKGKTVLLLTHDIEPVIDTIKVLKGRFKSFLNAHFLKTAGGHLAERAITANDIMTFAQICDKVIASSRPQMIKLIYLRRYFETLDDRGDTYEVLSNLFKRRQPPEDHRLQNDGSHELLSEVAAKAGIDQIKKKLGISEFDYDDVVSNINNKPNLLLLYNTAQNGYEKLQIYRLIDECHKNSVIRKYINETYHIENDFICQLDPTEFDPIPQYVINECDKAVLDFSTSEVSLNYLMIKEEI
jgi:energy-coupling factor transporter ATP-binding protein EcfA2